MKKVEHAIPFIDIVFQALGALIVVMATFQHVEAVPVNFATVSKEARITTSVNNPLFIVVSKNGLFSGKNKVKLNELKQITKDKEAILRIDKDIPYGMVMEVVSEIQNNAKNISMEVKKK